MCTSHDVKLEDIWHVLENIDPLKIPEEGKINMEDSVNLGKEIATTPEQSAAMSSLIFQFIKTRNRLVNILKIHDKIASRAAAAERSARSSEVAVFPFRSTRQATH